MLLTPLLSISGDNSTISDPTILRSFKVLSISSKSFQKNPPGSGVPVPAINWDQTNLNLLLNRLET